MSKNIYMSNVMVNNFYLSDLITGIFAELAFLKINIILVSDYFEHGLSLLINEDLPIETIKYNLSIKFRVKLHDLHKDSLVIQKSLYDAVHRGLIRFEYPGNHIFININFIESIKYFEGLPGSQEMYKELCLKFLKYYTELN